MPDQRIRLSGVRKTFGPVVALDDVDFDLAAGEIHALVGENGAGKSTLMRVLAGQMSADHGRLVVDGAESDLTDASRGFRTGVGFVEQEGGLIAELSGAENLLLATVGARAIADRRHAARTITDLAERFGGRIDPLLPVQQLAVGQRQRLEILIVMALGAEVLVLDEPTAALGSDEAEALGEIIRKFAAEGGSVVYISHKLAEVTRLADRITVMRRGRVVGRHESRGVSVEQLAVEMVGEVAGRRDRAADAGDELIDLALGVRAVDSAAVAAEVVCAVHGVRAVAPFPGEASLDGVDLVVRAGEVVGVAGLVGSGQTTLAEVLAGYTPHHAGTVEREGAVVAYIPENRHRDALALDLSISDNVLLHSHRRPQFRRGLWFRRDTARAHVDDVLERSNVVHGGRSQPMRSLSGGNQQKAVVGRELDEGPRVVVAHNPFRGLDVRAISEVRDAMLSAAYNGAGVVMISPDLDELRQIAHRIVVMFGGRIVGEVGVSDDDFERLGQLMGGVA